MMELLQFSLCLCAFNGFALAKFNHFKDIFGKRPTAAQRKMLLCIAWISILLSLTCCVVAQQGYGVLLFSGFMSLSVLITMVFYNFAVRFVKYFSGLNIAVTVFSAVFLAFN